VSSRLSRSRYGSCRLGHCEFGEVVVAENSSDVLLIIFRDKFRKSCDNVGAKIL